MSREPCFKEKLELKNDVGVKKSGKRNKSLEFKNGSRVPCFKEKPKTWKWRGFIAKDGNRKLMRLELHGEIETGGFLCGNHIHLKTWYIMVRVFYESLYIQVRLDKNEESRALSNLEKIGDETRSWNQFLELVSIDTHNGVRRHLSLTEIPHMYLSSFKN